MMNWNELGRKLQWSNQLAVGLKPPSQMTGLQIPKSTSIGMLMFQPRFECDTF
jgi:hypothetical protein